MEKNNIRVHFVQHEEYVQPGEYLSWAMRNGHAVTYTRCWLGESPDDVRDLPDMLVILGGPQCPATTKEECSYFDAAAERRLAARCIEAGKMVVGVCLGAQLVGEALGAEYSKSPEREIGSVEAELTDAGKADPFWSHVTDDFLAGEWHNDMPGITEDCEVLAYSEGCPRQIVRYGKYVYGLQTHMEFTPEIIDALLENMADSLDGRENHRFVQSEEELRSFDYSEMNSHLSGFLDKMTECWRGEQ